MPTPLDKKSNLTEIRERFDSDVERFSNLETGQAACSDAPLAMELITQAALAVTPRMSRVLDIGCGAGNNSLKLRLEAGFDMNFDLVDLSRPMLDRAVSRLSEINRGEVAIHQTDFPAAPFEQESFDVILAAAVLHHLRDEEDWLAAFKKLYEWLKPGGSLWITDLVAHDCPEIQAMMWNRYGDFLAEQGGEEYRDRVFEYVDKEDSPRSVGFQMDLMKQVGFKSVDLLHKGSCFAGFGGVK